MRFRRTVHPRDQAYCGQAVAVAEWPPPMGSWGSDGVDEEPRNHLLVSSACNRDTFQHKIREFVPRRSAHAH